MKTRRKRTNRTDRRNRQLLAGADIELLEDRRMLAGNVTAVINNAGDLVVNGDNADNDVLISIDDVGNVEVEGRVGSGTTVDDSGLAGKVVSRNVIVNMRGGDDGVYIDGTGTTFDVDAPVDNMRISTGSGDDIAVVGTSNGISVRGDIRMNLGTGDDHGAVKYSNVGFVDDGDTLFDGSVTITGGAGNDSSSLYYSIAGDFNVNLGAGNDLALVEATAAEGAMRLSVGSGDNTVDVIDSMAAGLRITSGGGIDAINIEEFDAKYASVDIATGNGADEVTITGGLDVDTLKIGTGGGNDNATIDEVEVERTEVNMGSGDDEASFEHSDFDDIRITMGSGDDTLFVHSSTVSGSANGNGGEDIFHWNWWSSVPDDFTSNFEFFLFAHDQHSGP